MNKLIRCSMATIAARLFCADGWAQAKKGFSLAELAAHTGADHEREIGRK